MEHIKEDQSLKLFYFQITDIWKRLCEMHTSLLDMTLDEYSLLLSSDLNKLEEKLEEKKLLLTQIGNIELLRSEVITKINKSIQLESKEEIVNIAGLISLMSLLPEEKQGKHLQNFNQYLIDIIEKIQAQNKKNQIFINKAVLSIKNIRDESLGKLNNKIYNAKGNAIDNSARRA